MMHCTMEELLAVRASEGSMWARQHVDACPVCRAELEALYQRVAQLKALPALSPARDRWSVVREDIEARRARRRKGWAVWTLAAAAAVAGLVVFHPFTTEPAYAAELAQAKQQSASLETTLQRYDPDSRVESGRAAALAAELEDRIAALDAELSRRATADRRNVDGRDLVTLWRDRVDLMQQLVDVHVTRAAYVGL